MIAQQNVKYNSEMPGMLLWTLAESQMVIKVDQHKIANLIPENAVHGNLASCWCIGQTKAEHSELKMAKRGSECSFGRIFIFDSDLMITALQI